MVEGAIDYSPLLHLKSNEWISGFPAQKNKILYKDKNLG
jgi:hypothetical protein